MDILIIDDETRRMRAIREMLRADGYTVEQVDSPTKALSMLQKNSRLCKVIVLDIMIPADGEFDVPESDYGLRTGILLLETLRGIPSFEIPVIVLTARRDTEEELKGKVDRFLHKPVPFDELSAAIREVIAKEKEDGKEAGNTS